MQGKYISKNDTNNYSVYGGPRIVRKYTTSDTVNYAVDEVLEQVVTFPEHKVEIIEPDKDDRRYYLYGTNTVQLSAIFDNTGYYNVIRISGETSASVKTNAAEVITLGLVQSFNREEYSRFELNTILYYTLPSMKVIISGDHALTSNVYSWDAQDRNICRIYHDLNGVIDFTLRKYNTTLSGYGQELFETDNVIEDKNTMTINLSGESTIQDSDLYELIIWKIDKIDSNIYKNVFTAQEFQPNDVEWKIYNTKEEFDLDLNYRFSFIGYNMLHDVPVYLSSMHFDPTEQSNLSTIIISGTNELSPRARTLNKKLRIVKDYQYVVNYDKVELENPSALTNRLQVLVPSFQQFEAGCYSHDCENIFAYTSILSQTIFVDNNNKADTNFNIIKEGLKEGENYTVDVYHRLNGDVKISIRNVATERYRTYVINDHCVRIEFPKCYKAIPEVFYVDLFLIWSKDNNEK